MTTCKNNSHFPREQDLFQPPTRSKPQDLSRSHRKPSFFIANSFLPCFWRGSQHATPNYAISALGSFKAEGNWIPTNQRPPTAYFLRKNENCHNFSFSEKVSGLGKESWHCDNLAQSFLRQLLLSISSLFCILYRPKTLFSLLVLFSHVLLCV